MGDRKGVVKMRKDKYNASGCKDMTAYEAIENIESEDRFKRLLAGIFRLCELSGFHLEGRIVVKDKKTGKVWR
jgi:hypothetical protein